MMRYLVVLLVLSVAGSNAAALRAQEPGSLIAGVVVDENRSPIVQARVAVIPAGPAALTDESGRFQLQGVGPGVHSVEVRRLGYQREVREVEVPRSGQTVRLEISLGPTPLTLPGVQVTGTPTPREVLFGTQATTQLHGRALERNLSSSVAQTLSQQPGMAVRYNGPGSAAPVIRGLTGDRILILQDGQRTGDLSGSGDDHSVTIDPLSAQRMEVVRGPAALMYGNNALGGVVNVITGEPATEIPPRSQWQAATQAETAFPGAAASVRGAVPVSEQWAFTVRGNARRVGDVRIGQDPALGSRLENTDQWNQEASVGVAYSGGAASGGVAVRGYRFGYGIPLPPEEDEEIRLAGRILAASARGEILFASPAFPSLRVSGTAQDYLDEELEDGETEMAFGLSTRTAELVLRQGAVGPIREGAWGISGLLRQYASTGHEQLTPPADSRAFGIFSYQEIPFRENGPSLQLGARLDHYAITALDDPAFGEGVSRSFPAASGSAGINVPLSEGVSVAANVARSFRAPTVEELFSNALHVGVAAFEVGDPTLNAETATGGEALVQVQRARWTGGAAVYRNQVQNFVYFEQRGDTVIDGTRWPILASAQDAARLTGAEGHLEWLVTDALAAGIRGDIVIAQRQDGEPLPFTPAPRLASSLRWTAGPWSVGGGVNHTFAQNRVAPEDEIETPAYTLLNMDASLRLTSAGRLHSISLRGENLSNRLYRDATSRIKHFAPNPGRNLALLYRVFF
jgi:iron complex outermembrane recepter protein